MEQEDEEFERLLGEIPHATANTPQSEGFDSFTGMVVTAAMSPDEAHISSIPRQMSPLLHPQAFGELLQVFQAVGELEACADKRSSPGYSGIIVGNPKEDIPNAPLHPEQSEGHQLLALEEEEEPLASLGFAESKPTSDPHMVDPSLAASFTEMKLNGTSRKSTTLKENGAEKMNITSSQALFASFHGVLMDSSEHQRVAVGIPVSMAGSSSILPLKSNVFFEPERDVSYGNSVHVSSDIKGGSVIDHLRQNASMNTFSNGTCNDGHGSGEKVLALTNGSYAAGKCMNNGLDGPRNVCSPVTLYSAKASNFKINAPPGSINGSADRGHFNMRANVGLLNSDSTASGHAHRSETFSGPFQDAHMLPQQGACNYSSVSTSLSTETGIYREAMVASYLQAQQLHKMQLAWQTKEEERYRMFVHQSQMLGCMQTQGPFPSVNGHNFTGPTFYTGAEPLCRSVPAGPTMAARDCRLSNCQGNAPRESYYEVPTSPYENHCTFFEQGFCSRGENCTVKHVVPKGAVTMRDLQLPSEGSHAEKQPLFPVKILSRKNYRASATSLATLAGSTREIAIDGLANGHAHTKGHSFGGRPEQHQIRGPTMDELCFDSCKAPEALQPQPKYTSLADVEGRIYLVAKDQHGCRFLQRKFDEGVLEDLQKIFLEIIDHVVELMTDPFGNYLIQKLLEVCSEDQRLEILNNVANKGELINVSLNMHGTRAVQKLIETLKSNQQVSLIIASLKSGVVTLIKDLNGNHVVQRCLQHLSNDDNQFIFEAAASHCFEIATHRHGCCVLQRCIDFSKGLPRQRLISEIAANSLLLSQDPFGNYVVQYILELGISWAFDEVMDRLAGNYAHLSMQKFSSNVVEKFLKLAGEDHRARVVHELMGSSHLAQLLQDPYANYVIQSALAVSKGSLHTSLVQAIRPHMPSLRSSPYGKRILSRRNLKKC